MRILVTGASGLVGGALIPSLQAEGHEIVPLVRSKSAKDAGPHWNPNSGILDLAALEDFGAVVHLAGENIASGRWTAERKRRISESRSRGTSLLAGSLSKLRRPPHLLLSASAIGYYGDRGSELLSEDSLPGNGFLSEVCCKWEEATAPAEKSGIRVVRVRIGVVLSTRGGALAKMLLPFRLGLGGRIGSGSQYVSWISLTDLCGLIRHVIQSDSLHGPVNAVAPAPVTNSEFTRALGDALHRPTIFPLPAFVARMALGEMADELLLSSARVSAAKAEASGYSFHDREIRAALRRILAEGV